MAHTIALTDQQVERYDEYVYLQQTIKELTEQASIIRTELEQQVHDANVNDDEVAVFIVKDKIIEFSVVAKSFKFVYDIKDYIEETNAYETLSVSSTEAKKALNTEQLNKYFNIEKGTRRLKIK